MYFMLYSKILTIYFELHVHGGMNAHVRVRTLGGQKRGHLWKPELKVTQQLCGLRSSARAEPSLQPLVSLYEKFRVTFSFLAIVWMSSFHNSLGRSFFYLVIVIQGLSLAFQKQSVPFVYLMCVRGCASGACGVGGEGRGAWGEEGRQAGGGREERGSLAAQADLQHSIYSQG